MIHGTAISASSETGPGTAARERAIRSRRAGFACPSDFATVFQDTAYGIDRNRLDDVVVHSDGVGCVGAIARGIGAHRDDAQRRLNENRRERPSLQPRLGREQYERSGIPFSWR
jgi:hypothetical protein